MQLFEQPVYFIYLLIALSGLAGIYWLGTRLKRRIAATLFGQTAYARLSGCGDAWQWWDKGFL